jgi:phenylpropionate dioxygenase-like ring-hydroxylating dioxygenase large terminal subunit
LEENDMPDGSDKNDASKLETRIDPATIPYPQHLTIEKPPYRPEGVRRVPVQRFFKQEYHDLEVERIWKKSWQWACREEEIPNVGDYTIYEVAELSFIVIRTGEDEIKAYWNSCLHRGRKIRDFDGKRATELRCMFHGWAWNIDGGMKDMTCGWDFPGTREEVTRLPEAKVGTWGGFVFINPDPQAESLEDFLGELPAHFASPHDHRDRWKQVHVQAVLPVNWKICQEAFLEGWHTAFTHPQLVFGRAEGDVRGYGMRWDDFGNWMRSAPGLSTDQHKTPAANSLNVADTPQRFLDSYYERHMNEEPHIRAEEGVPAHKTVLNEVREWYRQQIGEEIDQWHDYQLMGGEMVSVWPNFHPWGGLSRLVYRFRPYKSDPEKCVMDVALMAPWPKGVPRPPPGPIHKLELGQSISEAPEIGMLARIFMQDIGNMSKVQEGLKTSRQGYVIISQHQEAPVRHFHDLYDKWMGFEDGDYLAEKKS